MNIALFYIISITTALNFVRDFANGCESQKCIDASTALSNKCKQDEANVLECICKLDDNDYWKKLSDCIQSCDVSSQDGIDTSPDGLRQLYCSAASAYASLSTLFPTNSFDLSDFQVTGTETSDIGDLLDTLSALSVSQETTASGEASETEASSTKTSESAMGTSTHSSTSSEAGSSESTSNVAATAGYGTLISFLVLALM
ncbi:hypothetical protein CANMA_004162 [Candida margitis]|uniref:uncharacterized protein n=1 Tax=Candida margitis TaxID=1775924 RepID=UPI002226C082|nr:uncharacterized protein CANMA_004162 [Candida margitis]KAI5959038.1 hypothetical protein CANMA_004162 [Candida margitis]